MNRKPQWFESESIEDVSRVQFAHAPGGAARVPSWLPGARSRKSKQGPEPSLKPPKLPNELVDAIRQELNDTSLERGQRHSRPPDSTRGSQWPRRDEIPRGSLGVPRADSLGLSVPAPGPAAPVPQAAARPVPVADPVVTRAFEEALAALNAERHSVLAETASQLAELATIIARRVIARELSVDPGLVSNLVREGLESLAQHDRVLVRIGPGFAAARGSVEQTFSSAQGPCEVRVDATVGDYGCVVETELGRVDESIELRLGTLLRSLSPDSEAQ